MELPAFWTVTYVSRHVLWLHYAARKQANSVTFEQAISQPLTSNQVCLRHARDQRANWMYR